MGGIKRSDLSFDFGVGQLEMTNPKLKFNQIKENGLN
jgi:hypothetical protein